MVLIKQTQEGNEESLTQERALDNDSSQKRAKPRPDLHSSSSN